MFSGYLKTVHLSQKEFAHIIDKEVKFDIHLHYFTFVLLLI